MNVKKYLIKSIFCMALSFGCLAVFAQTKTISGTVTDEQGNPISGASVKAVGTNGGTFTSAAGTFDLKVQESVSQLEISYVGYASQTVEVNGGGTNVSVKLKAVNTSLNDVVVIGYGTARKKDLTGAVASISSANFTTGNLASPIQSIQGKVPGLSVTVPGGDPTTAPIIRLRGQTSLSGGQTPLIVVDNVPLDDPDQLTNIPPGDIATYDVLKDASATSIYGSRGANGVIIITTKKGRTGAPEVTYNGSGSMDHIAKEYPLANASQFNQGIQLLGTETGESQTDINSSIAEYAQGGNTNWQDAITRTAFSNNHNISLAGGANGFSYRGSVSYANDQGIVINTGKQFVGLRFNVDQKALNDKLDLQAGIVNTITNKNYADYNIFYEAYTAPPTYPVKNSDGSYFNFYDFALQNPVEQQMQEQNTGRENLSLLYGSADYTILPGLVAGVRGSLSYFNNQLNFYQPVFPVVNNQNTAATGASNTDSKKGDIHVNYTHDWGKSHLSATGVYEYNDFTYDDQAGVGQNFLVDQNQSFNMQAGQQIYTHNYSYKDQYLLISFLGRAEYNWDGRYYLTASIRRDGSSKFGADNQWGTFPAASVAWNIARENFMKGASSWLNELKLRAGIGVTGNQDAISPYSTRELYGPVGNYYSNGNYLSAYAITQNANPELRWEERVGKNIGLDFTMFDSRLYGTFNYFNDKTNHLLYTYNLPAGISGSALFPYATILANVGNMSNKGVEFSLNYKIINHKDFTWTMGGQISSVNTKITSLSGSYGNGSQTFQVSTDNIPGGYAEGRGLSSQPITYLKVGYSPYVFNIPHYEGTVGGLETYDSSGSTTSNINNATMHYIDPSPKFNYGISSDFTYKQWGLSFFLRGVYGQRIFDNIRMLLDNINRFAGNNGTVSALTNGITNSAQVSDHWLENASFLRLDNINLSYTVNLKSTMVQALKFYFAGNNLFVITPYRGLDPEIRNAAQPAPFIANYITSATGNGNIYATGSAKGTSGTTAGTLLSPSSEAYIDAAYQGDGYYPRSRSFTIGVNVNFK